MVGSGSTTSNKSNTRSKSMKNLLDRSRMSFDMPLTLETMAGARKSRRFLPIKGIVSIFGLRY